MIEKLLEALKQHNVSCKELKPLSAKQGIFWRQHSFNLFFKGSFKNIKSFMHDFFAQQQFISCEKLFLTRWKDNKIKGKLRVTFTTFGEPKKRHGKT